MVAIKVEFRSEAKKLDLPDEDVSLNKMYQLIKSVFEDTLDRLELLHYIDADGHVIPIGTDDDLNKALNTLGRKGQLTLKVDGYSRWR